MLVARPAGMLLLNLVTNQAIAPGMTNLIRWQSHWHVVRQSWTFFQNDFAGRIANRVMQVGPALRDSIVATTNAVWYIVVYGGSAMLLLGGADPWLALPLALWFAAMPCMLRFMVPRARERSRRMSEARSGLTGRVVDSYTNILTVKLFARASDEDAHVAEAIDEHTVCIPEPGAADHQPGCSACSASMPAWWWAPRRCRSGCGRAAPSASARWRWRCRWPGR